VVAYLLTSGLWTGIALPAIPTSRLSTSLSEDGPGRRAPFTQAAAIPASPASCGRRLSGSREKWSGSVR